MKPLALSMANSQPPMLPQDIVDTILDSLSPDEAPFVKHLSENLTLDWLDDDDDRLGVTRFDGDHNEMFRKRRLKLPPGKIEILLNPILLEDEILYRHTVAHELLHAAGLLEHDQEHEALVDSIAPSPSIEESPLLQKLRDKVLGEMSRKEWICQNCGFTYARTTVRKPLRCPKCARKL